MSDWGKGATNNDIGWGQGANNEIGWGAIHALSYSGDTDIVGAAAVDDRFIFTVKTDNAGTSASNQFTIPTSTSGITQAFNYDIETSDGQTITGLTGSHTITFPTAGTYEVRISGSFPYMFFNNGGDRLKMLDISNFGIYALGATSQANAFKSCNNMTITATDTGNFGSVTNFQSAWENCSSLTSFPLIDTSNGTSFRFAWFGCSSLTSFPLINTSSGTNFQNAWQSCSSLTSFPLLDTSSGTNFQGAWQSCTSLANYPANAFDTNIATNYTSAFLTTNLTTQSIDDILVSLDTSGVSNGTFNQSGGQAPSVVGETAIDNLVSKGWTIVVTGGYTPPDFTTNLVASYSFDTDFSDYTGNNNLTAFGNAIAGVASGKVSNCAELDGASDYTIAADSDDFSFTNGTNDLPFSISFWANFLTHSPIANDASWIITKRDNSTNEEYQISFSGNLLRIQLFSQGTISAALFATLPFIPITGGTTWQHFTFTYDGSQTFSGIKMYIDGVSQTLTDSSVGTYLGMINGSASINIGSQGWNPTLGEFDGKLDEFHVWKNRELTSAEVLEIYNTENAGNSILP